MSSKHLKNKNEIHIIPFNSKYSGHIKVENCDLSREETTIRGVKVVKVCIDPDIKLYDGSEEIKGLKYYWKFDSTCCNDKFAKGLKLVNEGLGLQKKSHLSQF